MYKQEQNKSVQRPSQERNGTDYILFQGESPSTSRCVCADNTSSALPPSHFLESLQCWLFLLRSYL
jgi:hypothetical protein